MSILIGARPDDQRYVDGSAPVASQHSRMPLPGSKFTPSSLGRSYVTPDSSVSPVIDPKDMKDSPDHSMGSDDETDDLYMDGIDDVGARDAAPASVADSPYLDAAGVRVPEDPAISPATLAEAYLPALFAQHGPCAIRHLTQYLVVNNPKFGALPQGKQRRLIVKALELKKGILFEKVGWGRWNSIEGKMTEPGLFTPESMPHNFNRIGSLTSGSLKQSAGGHASAHLRPPLMGSYPASSYSSQHDFMFSPSLSVADTLREDEDDGDIDPLDLDLDDGDSETDEEDWKSLGAKALRARQQSGSVIGSYRDASCQMVGSFSTSQRSSPYPIRRKSSAGIYQMNSPGASSGLYSLSPGASRPSFPKTSSYLKSSPMSNTRASSFSRSRETRPKETQSSPTQAAIDTKTARQDRGAQAEAVEALVMLASSYDDRRN